MVALFLRRIRWRPGVRFSDPLALATRSCEMESARAANSICSLPQPNPGLPGFGHFSLPEAGKPAAGWGRVGGGSCGDAPTLPHTTTPTPNPSPQGGGECAECAV